MKTHPTRLASQTRQTRQTHLSRLAGLIAVASLAGLSASFLAGCHKAPETPNTTPPKISVGTEIDDSVVTATVKSALLADPDVKSFDLKVETRKGEVQLSGFVDSPVQMDRAIAVTNSVSGVKKVQNSMSLKGAPATVGNTIDDSIISTRVKSALLSDDQVKSSDIAVVTRKGEVQLSGFVNDQRQIDRAIAVAKGVEGVSSVSNELSIKK